MTQKQAFLQGQSGRAFCGCYNPRGAPLASTAWGWDTSAVSETVPQSKGLWGQKCKESLLEKNPRAQ